MFPLEVKLEGKVVLKHKTVKMCISSLLLSMISFPASHVNKVGMGDDGESICVIFRIWLRMRNRVLKLESLHQCGHEDEETVLRQTLAHADPATKEVQCRKLDS